MAGRADFGKRTGSLACGNARTASKNSSATTCAEHDGRQYKNPRPWGSMPQCPMRAAFRRREWIPARLRRSLGQRRRIKNHQIEFLFGRHGEPLKSIGLNCFMCATSDRRSRLVEAENTLGAFKGVGADVEIRHGTGAPARGVEREAAGKTEGVQDVAVFGESFDVSAIFALIKKEAGFLTAQNVCLKAEPAFQKYGRTIKRRSSQNLSI